ncbi:DNA-3-methyladenine glycosylase 2 family protein [Maribacter sp.]|nr:DNA-3-methyladenine glycosylase 2 family protein [Maribacter sp.]
MPNSNDIKSIITPEAVTYLSTADENMKRIHERYGLPPDWKRPASFISLAKIILGQQVSLASAEAHFQKLNGYLPDFSPKQILKLSEDEMRTCQISRQKASYLRALSHTILDGFLSMDELSHLEESEIREKLTSIKGIGQWTADVFLLFCIQSEDIFPIGDIAVVNTIKKLYKVKTKEEIITVAETWKPYRSLATYFLWHYYLSEKGKIFLP